MENITAIPNRTIMPKHIDENQMTEDELCADLLEALEEIERGNVYTIEEVEAEFTRLYGIKF